MDQLTRSERQVASALLQDYPVAGLGTVTTLADAAEVSTPTVIRMARKLGFEGFPDFQAALRDEVAAQLKAPMLKAGPPSGAPSHGLTRFAEAVVANLNATLDRVDTGVFDGAADLLADTARPVYIAGGRITRSNADYLFNHLQIIRPAVTHLSHSANVWPQYLLDMDDRSVLVVFDIRRYERDLLKLARLGKERGASVVLFTDQWGSDIAALSDLAFHGHVEVPSNWDSTIGLMLIVEALVAQVQARLWDESRARMTELEAMFGKTKLFRSFS